MFILTTVKPLILQEISILLSNKKIYYRAQTSPSRDHVRKLHKSIYLAYTLFL
jgi:hypothetical protein